MDKYNCPTTDRLSKADIVYFLREAVIFSRLTVDETSALAHIAIDQFFQKGTVLIEEGDVSKSLHVVLCGLAQAFSQNENGKKVIYNVFRPGDCFGEFSFIDGKPRSASVETILPTRILTIPRDRFERVVFCNPSIFFNLMRGLTEKLRITTWHNRDLLFALSHGELRDADLDTLRRLVLAAESKNDNSRDHLRRISRYIVLLAEKAGFSDDQVHHIRHAAPIHDIGKIGIPEQILLKPGRLLPEEFEVIKTHSLIGAKILSSPQSDILKTALAIVRWHHERFDGNGYPDRLKGEDIPLTARLTAIVDAFDALTTKRPYKPAYSAERAVDIMQKERGTHFDPDLFNLFLENIDEMIAIRTDESAEPLESDESSRLS